MNKDAKSFEERKCEASWDPAQRWKVLQQTIAWVDAQQPVSRNSSRACLQKQAELLANRWHADSSQRTVH